MTEFFIGLLIMFCINVILASSLNMINGYCGLFSIGHAGFFAVGAYVGAVGTKIIFPELAASAPHLAFLLACLLGTFGAGIAGLIVGIPCLRLTGDYLAIVTVGFGEIIRIVILNLDFVGGSRGFPGILKLTNVWWAVSLTILTLVVLRNIISSSFGRCIIAIREDEIAARSMGIDVRFYKTFAFVLGSSFAGLAGVIFAHYLQFISPTNFTFMISINILTMIVLGGIGSQTGAIIGALIVTLVPELLRFNETLSQIRTLIFGLILVVMMLWSPNGLMGFFKREKKAL